jgi:hypothetical protein
MRHACKVQKREDDLRRCHEELVEERRGKRFREHAGAGAASARIEHKREAEGEAERRTARRQIRGKWTVVRHERGEGAAMSPGARPKGLRQRWWWKAREGGRELAARDSDEGRELCAANVRETEGRARRAGCPSRKGWEVKGLLPCWKSRTITPSSFHQRWKRDDATAEEGGGKMRSSRTPRLRPQAQGPVTLYELRGKISARQPAWWGDALILLQNHPEPCVSTSAWRGGHKAKKYTEKVGKVFRCM